MKVYEHDSPRTPEEAIHNLWGAVFFRAIKDGDAEWLDSPDYFIVAELAGINEHLAALAKQRIQAGILTRESFAVIDPALTG